MGLGELVANNSPQLLFPQEKPGKGGVSNLQDPSLWTPKSQTKQMVWSVGMIRSLASKRVDLSRSFF